MINIWEFILQTISVSLVAGFLLIIKNIFKKFQKALYKSKKVCYTYTNNHNKLIKVKACKT